MVRVVVNRLYARFFHRNRREGHSAGDSFIHVGAFDNDQVRMIDGGVRLVGGFHGNLSMNEAL